MTWVSQRSRGVLGRIRTPATWRSPRPLSGRSPILIPTPLLMLMLWLVLFLMHPVPVEAQMKDDSGGSAHEAQGEQTAQIVTLGGGCFWCLEAIFDRLQGVTEVESGYSGGRTASPGYKEVCSGETGHAEVVQVTFDPAAVSLLEVLEVFFTMHDPTTLNRQGADVGTQYRSVIFYRDAEQKRVAEEVMREVRDEKLYDRPLVTQLVPFEVFYKAEDYHQEYFARNPEQGYCQIVIAPKVAKFREKFQDKLR